MGQLLNDFSNCFHVKCEKFLWLVLKDSQQRSLQIKMANRNNSQSERDVGEARGEKEVGSGNHGEHSKFAINADNEAVEPSLAVPGVKGKGIVEQY